jgi:hypothetical protein
LIGNFFVVQWHAFDKSMDMADSWSSFNHFRCC